LALLQEIINLLFVGRLDNSAAKLTGVGMGNAMITVTGLVVIFGIN